MIKVERKRKSLIIIPFSLPWDWTADYERQTAITLAKKGYEVIAFLEKDSHFLLKIKKKKYPKIDRIFFYTPVCLLPFGRLSFVKKINQFINLNYLVFRYGLRKKIILWIFDPIFHNLPKFMLKKNISLYDCVDYVGSPKSKLDKIIKKREKRLINNVDYFFVNSSILKRIHSRQSKKTHLVPQGFLLDVFKKPLKTKKLFSKEKALIGFVGSVDYRLDFPLLFKLIKNNPDYNFVFWGPINFSSNGGLYKNTKKNIEKLLNSGNVIYGKSNDRREIPNIIKQFDVGIIPYDVKQKVNKYCYPMKLFEYFYLGKPVISTAIVELFNFEKLVFIARSYREWQKKIKEIFCNKWSSDKKNEQRASALENSWDEKISQICSTLF